MTQYFLSLNYTYDVCLEGNLNHMSQVIKPKVKTLPAAMGWFQRNKTIDAYAIPGLITILDQALFRANEGGLTGTVSSADVLLSQFLRLKKEARELLVAVLHDYHLYNKFPECCDTLENFARLCIECANGVAEHLTTDKLALASNIDYTTAVSGQLSGSSSALGSSPIRGMGIGSSSKDSVILLKNSIGVRRSDSEGVNTVNSATGVAFNDEAIAVHLEHASSTNMPKRRRDCYETPRLICPDYVWAEDAVLFTQRALKAIQKHPAMALSSGSANVVKYDLTSLGYQEKIDLLYMLIKVELPDDFASFKAAVSADAVVSKRLYLIKCEYRAPFRGFLESHRNLQRAPDKIIVDEIVSLYQASGKLLDGAKLKLDSMKESALAEKKRILDNTTLVDAFQIEHCCEVMEVAMSRMLHPYAELARLMDSKNYRLKEIQGKLAASDVASFREVLRRLKALLVRKASQEATGIRPLLLDLQGESREKSLECIQIFPQEYYSYLSPERAIKKRIEKFMKMLVRLCDICIVMVEKREYELPSSILRECADVDTELFYAQYEDWYNGARRQQELIQEGFFDRQPETLRRAEVNLGVLKASHPTLIAVQGKLETLKKERMKRFEFLQETVSEVCSRELGVNINLIPPDDSYMLSLPQTSIIGVFGQRLLMENETLPIG